MIENLLITKKQIKLAKLLMNDFVHKDVILATLDIKEAVFSKYLTQLKKVGFNIIKKDRKYRIKSYSNQINLSHFENCFLAYVLGLSKTMLSKEKFQALFKIYGKLSELNSKENFQETLKYLKKYLKKQLNNKFQKKIKILEKYIEEERILEITTLNKKILELTPKSFEFEKDKINAIFLDNMNKKFISIPIDNIARIFPLNDFHLFDSTQETIFEIYGRLKDTYLLKNDEILIDSFKDKIVVSNYGQDKNLLFKRLLKYDTLAKIIFPKSDAEKFSNLIKKSLDNLDKFDNNIIKEEK